MRQIEAPGIHIVTLVKASSCFFYSALNSQLYIQAELAILIKFHNYTPSIGSLRILNISYPST